MKRQKIMWYNSWQQAKHAKPGLSPFQQNTLHCVLIVILLLLSTDNHQMMFEHLL